MEIPGNDLTSTLNSIKEKYQFRWWSFRVHMWWKKRNEWVKRKTTWLNTERRRRTERKQLIDVNISFNMKLFHLIFKKCFLFSFFSKNEADSDDWWWYKHDHLFSSPTNLPVMDGVCKFDVISEKKLKFFVQVFGVFKIHGVFGSSPRLALTWRCFGKCFITNWWSFPVDELLAEWLGLVDFVGGWFILLRVASITLIFNWEHKKEKRARRLEENTRIYSRIKSTTFFFLLFFS